VFDTGVFPEEWAKSIIVPLYKKGDADNPDNYRGISLLSTASKIFTSILNSRLTKWAETNSVINEAQAGFRQGYSTVDHIFTLHAMIEKQFSKNGKLYVAFVDFAKAFDTVNHGMLWLVLTKTGIRGKMLTMLQGVYASIMACVRCGNNNDLTDFFECLQGIKQGCLCSPILFTFFINELANDIINSGRHGIQMLPNQLEIFLMLFADDLALLSSTVIGLQNQLNLLYESSRRLGLRVNLSKTKVMVFRKGGHLAAGEKWCLGDEVLEVVGKYKYLGLNFSTMLSFNIGTEDFVTRARKGVIEIYKALKSNGCQSRTVFFKLFDAQIAPSLLYAAEIWGHTENKQIEKVHLYACKLFLNVPNMTPNDMVYGELGRYPLYVDAACKCVMYWFRVLKQPPSRYSRMSYESLLTLHERGHVNWVSYVKTLLCSNGFDIVWQSSSVGDEKLFLRDLKERLKVTFKADWKSHVSQSARFNLYDSFKCLFTHENYVDIINVNIYRNALTRFRLGVSPFNAHRKRYSSTETTRECPFCPGNIEDEVHVVFLCQAYKSIRRQYIGDMVFVSFQEELLRLFLSEEEQMIVHFAKFLFLANQTRKRKIEEEGASS